MDKQKSKNEREAFQPLMRLVRLLGNFFRSRRAWSKTTYPDGTVEEFDPIFTWHLIHPIYEIGIKGKYEIGIMFGYHVGEYSKYRKKYIEIGNAIIYLHLGMTEPHNPRTGEVYSNNT